MRRRLFWTTMVLLDLLNKDCIDYLNDNTDVPPLLVDAIAALTQALLECKANGQPPPPPAAFLARWLKNNNPLRNDVVAKRFAARRLSEALREKSVRQVRRRFALTPTTEVQPEETGGGEDPSSSSGSWNLPVHRWL